MTIDYGIERDLRAIPAAKELLQLKLLRAVGNATDEGVPQRTIACSTRPRPDEVRA